LGETGREGGAKAGGKAASCGQRAVDSWRGLASTFGEGAGFSEGLLFFQEDAEPLESLCYGLFRINYGFV
jgi:hypothetical protein